MTPETLNEYTRTELASLARKQGVEGWHSMRKQDLVDALLATHRPASKQNGAKRNPTRSASNSQHYREKPLPSASPKVNTTSTVSNTRQNRVPAGGPQTVVSNGQAVRDLSRTTSSTVDRFLVLVRDPHWLQAIWQISRETIQRAEKALGADWYRAVPVIRLYDVSEQIGSGSGEVCVREIEIHSGVNYWHIPIQGLSRTYRLHLGFRVSAQHFHLLARSNTVTPPRPGSASTTGGIWEEIGRDYQRIFSMSGGYSENSPLRDYFEENLGRGVESLHGSHLAVAEDDVPVATSLELDFHAEVVVHGRTDPQAKLVVQGEPVRLDQDGTFHFRIRLEDGRQVLPMVATSVDGRGQRTIVLALERNTRELEPQPLEE